MAKHRRRLLICGLLALATLAVYAQTTRFEFVRLDDTVYVTRNPHVQQGLTLEGVWIWSFIAIMLMITFIDWEHQIIPDVITLPGIILFALAAIFFMDVTPMDSLIGILAGGGCLYLVAFVYQLLTKREGMGGGDIKLLAMLGGFLGWQSLWLIIMASSLIGAVAGISAMNNTRNGPRLTP